MPIKRTMKKREISLAKLPSQGRKEIPMPIKKKPQNIEDSTVKILVENFVSLQKVMANLSFKFDHLSNQITKLLEVFEISAKSLAQKDFNLPDDKEINKKLDNLFEQNKVLARGLALLHEKPEPPQQKPTGFSRPMTRESEPQKGNQNQLRNEGINSKKFELPPR